MPYKTPAPVTVDVDGIVRKTSKAILVKCDHKEVWIPLSKLFEPPEKVSDTHFKITIPEWLAMKEGLI